MKIYSLLSIAIFLTVITDKCKNKNEGNIYKGRLEAKGICMNYTIKLLEGSLDTSRIVSEWKNESTGKIHTNVFALGSACSFPSTINEGDEFYFKVDSAYVSNCAVCLAYYPKPAKSIPIKVVNK